MSHNILMSNVKFHDLVMLGNIVNDLSKGAARLDTAARTFRTYRGQDPSCDAAIIMPDDSRMYGGAGDIGLKRQKDGSFSPVMDPMLIGNTFRGKFDASNPIGTLQQEYTLRQAEYEAAQRGMATERITGERGRITLAIAEPA